MTVVLAASAAEFSAANTATGILLWVSAVGGLAALAFDIAAGASGGLLWLTVPVAAVLLVYRSRSSASRS